MANYPGRGPNFPYKPGQFKPGNKASPGRPRDAGLTALIREVLRSKTIRGKPIPDGKTVEEVLAEVFVAEALKGKFLFCKELMDRMEGKVPDRVQHSGDADGQPIPVVIIRGVSAAALLPKPEPEPEPDPEPDPDPESPD